MTSKIMYFNNLSYWPIKAVFDTNIDQLINNHINKSQKKEFRYQFAVFKNWVNFKCVQLYYFSSENVFLH